MTDLERVRALRQRLAAAAVPGVVASRVDVAPPGEDVRVAISNQALAPWPRISDVSIDRIGGRGAGMVFSTQVAEVGGLSAAEEIGHVSFDRALQDQVISIDAGRWRSRAVGRLAFLDRPLEPMAGMLLVTDAWIRAPNVIAKAALIPRLLVEMYRQRAVRARVRFSLAPRSLRLELASRRRRGRYRLEVKERSNRRN